MNALTIALLAAGTMAVSDILATVCVMAESRGRGWLAGVLDSAGWLVSITTTAIAVTALQGHSLTEKVLVVVLVTAANLLGTKLGQIIGSRFVTDGGLDGRVAALEAAVLHHQPPEHE
jgi:hypothetical protein